MSCIRYKKECEVMYLGHSRWSISLEQENVLVNSTFVNYENLLTVPKILERDGNEINKISKKLMEEFL